MNALAGCLLCKGSGKIRITDYVDHCLKHDWPVTCPICQGQGVVFDHRTVLTGGVL